MLIAWSDLVAKYRIQPTGVLHVGAHMAEEASIYDRAGIHNVWWVEANPFLIEPLERVTERYGHHVIHAAVSEKDDEQVTLKVTNNGQSSSLLNLHRHLQVSPDVWQTQEVALTTQTIDSVVGENAIHNCNFLNMDIQGAELLALKGATNYLKSVEWVYTEINTWELYRGCARVWELDEYLAPQFVRTETKLAGDVGWGDALYIRRPL